MDAIVYMQRKIIKKRTNGGNMETIKIKYFDDELERISSITKGNWIDLRAAENVVIGVNEFKLIPLGIAMELPEGCEAHIVPRSSTFKKWGIIQTNHCGIVDTSYCGDNDEWKFPAYCLEAKGYKDGKNVTVIQKGDRICQFRIIESMPAIEFEEVETLGNDDRGGFGSTGTR